MPPIYAPGCDVAWREGITVNAMSKHQQRAATHEQDELRLVPPLAEEFSVGGGGEVVARCRGWALSRQGPAGPRRSRVRARHGPDGVLPAGHLPWPFPAAGPRRRVCAG